MRFASCLPISFAVQLRMAIAPSKLPYNLDFWVQRLASCHIQQGLPCCFPSSPITRLLYDIYSSRLPLRSKLGQQYLWSWRQIHTLLQGGSQQGQRMVSRFHHICSRVVFRRYPPWSCNAHSGNWQSSWQSAAACEEAQPSKGAVCEIEIAKLCQIFKADNSLSCVQLTSLWSILGRKAKRHPSRLQSVSAIPSTWWANLCWRIFYCWTLETGPEMHLL